MGDKTGIEWTDATWNPVVGCAPVSEGCRNCYAAREAVRFGANPKVAATYEGLAEMRGADASRRAVFTGKIRTLDHRLDQPLRWKRPRRIFVNSMSDLFHPDVPVAFISEVFRVMSLAPQHTFQVLTKRPERMAEYLRGDCPLPNVWLGTSVEDQAAADERVPHLLDTPAAVRFLSCEPLLGDVDLRPHLYGLDWVIVGGESGPRARPMHPSWVRRIRNACIWNEVPFLFKQWGAWENGDSRVGKKAAGRLLDGRTWDETPEKAVPA